MLSQSAAGAAPDQGFTESDGEIIFSGSDGYTMTVSSTLSSTSPPRLSKTTMNGKWLGASCGDLQPL